MKTLHLARNGKKSELFEEEPYQPKRRKPEEWVSGPECKSKTGWAPGVGTLCQPLQVNRFICPIPGSGECSVPLSILHPYIRSAVVPTRAVLSQSVHHTQLIFQLLVCKPAHTGEPVHPYH